MDLTKQLYEKWSLGATSMLKHSFEDNPGYTQEEPDLLNYFEELLKKHSRVGYLIKEMLNGKRPDNAHINAQVTISDMADMLEEMKILGVKARRPGNNEFNPNSPGTAELDLRDGLADMEEIKESAAT